MMVQQIKPEYTKIVAAIPHSVGRARYWQWQHNEAARQWRDRYVDWFTDELFGLDMPGVAIVKANVCRLECDVERLEGEKDRLCNFAHIGGDNKARDMILGSAIVRNGCLSEWYRYRAEILEAAQDGVAIIIDCHSFPSDIAPDVDVCIGFNDDESKPSLQTIGQVERRFRDAGYAVAFNRPFANALAPMGYIGHSLMIEVNKRVYMDEKTLQKNDGFEKMKATIGSLYHELQKMGDHENEN